MPKDFDDTKNIDLSIIEAYGSREGLAEALNRGILMLHFLEPMTFEQRDIQNVASAIRITCEFLKQGC